MNTQKINYPESLMKLAAKEFQKILYVDITDDSFEVLSVGNSEWNKKENEQPSGKISEWFCWFADGPFCNENDRARFKDFTDLNNLKELFESNGYEHAGIVYRRKFDLTDQIYSTVSMELIPEITEEGHLAAFLFVRNISAELLKYNASIEETASMGSSASGKRSVLIVEDNEMNRELLAEILSETYTVLQAENGAVGIELLQQNMTDVSVVILDVQMPVMNGYEFLQAVGDDPFMSSIPVVVATGSDSVEEERRCLQLGASDFVTKPYNPDIILSRIANMIRLRESAATMTMLQTDDRTGLYTLQAFYYYSRIALDKNPEKSYSLTIFDVNRFKHINEIYGEEVGNSVLQRIAEVLNGYTAASDIFGRFGAARFLLLTELMSDDETEKWINGLFASLEKACGVKGLSFKAGIYEDIDKTLSISAICDRAIIALNSVGENFKNHYKLYDKNHAEKERRLAVMEADMQEAYHKEQFTVYYQPKHEAATGRLVGAEALIRWIHPTYGFLSPAEFIPLFERNGFVSYVDYFVLKKTCSNLRKWLDEGLSPVPVSVNASRRDFEQDFYIDTLMKPLKANGVDPRLIHIEVTESLFSDRMEELSVILQACRDAGFHIELDDFGAGYSSLTTLAALPLDVMKLDMSFMKNYKDEKKRKILSTCINLAKSLGLKTVSEGVETEEQLELLKSYGCDIIQGYYFSKPLPEDEFRAYLKKNL